MNIKPCPSFLGDISGRIVLDPLSIAALAATCFVASLVQGMTGFAFGLITIGVLSLLTNARDASIILTFLAGVSIIYTFYSVRHAFRWSHLRPMAIGAVLGLPPGISILLWADPDWLKILVGAALISVSVLRLGGIWRPSKALSGVWAYGAGFVGGVLGGSMSIAGPPVAVYTMTQKWTQEEIKATLLAYFMFGLAIKSVLLISANAIRSEHLINVALMIPVILAGTAVGIRLFHRVNRAQFTKWVYALLFILGIRLVW